MRILLTGSSGMVGRNILEHSASQAHEFLTPSHKDLDLLNYNDVEHYIKLHQIDLVIHAAGRVGGIQANMANPVGFLLDNLNMGQNVVMAAKNTGVKQVLNIGSSCMYPRNVPTFLTEEMVLAGELEPTNEGYAIAKATIARLCDYISQTNPDYQYKTLIPCNLYGRWDKFDPKHSHMIPAVIRKIHEAKTQKAAEVEIWGDGLARREFMYAGDLADCVLDAITRLHTLPNMMNVGLGFDYTINEYYQTIAACIGFTGSFTHDLTKPVGMQRKLVNIDKVTEWGWKASHSLEQGIQKAYQFYLEQEGVTASHDHLSAC